MDNNVLAPTKFLLFNILNRVASSARVISYLIFLVVALLLQGVGRLSERAGNQPELVDLVSKRVNARLKSADPLRKIVVVPSRPVGVAFCRRQRRFVPLVAKSVPQVGSLSTEDRAASEAAHCWGRRISFTASSHNLSGLRSPALTSAMSFVAIAW
jgi:hypothetical protein